MGYTTEYDGQISVEPPLNPTEVAYLQAFAATWRGERPDDPYYIGSEISLDHTSARLIPFNPRPPAGQPNERCCWTPTDDGSAIVWDGSEKFYDGPDWMQYLIDHFLTRTAGSFAADPRSEGFTFDHQCHGHLRAQGEDFRDRWALAVSGNRVEIHALY
jgi:hypothetical protein